MITLAVLRDAQRRLRKRAGRQFPELLAADVPGPSLEAALKAVDIDVDDAMKFVKANMKHNKLRLAEAGIITPAQRALYAVAMANGIAIGVVASDLEG